MQDYFLLRRRNLFPLFFVSLLLFVCFCLSPQKGHAPLRPWREGGRASGKAVLSFRYKFSALFVYNYAPTCIVYN